MKKATVTVSFEQEKLKAVQFYAGKNGTSLELELDILPAPAYWLAGLPAFHSPGIAPAVPAPQTDSSNGHMRKSKQSPHTNLL